MPPIRHVRLVYVLLACLFWLQIVLDMEMPGSLVYMLLIFPVLVMAMANAVSGLAFSLSPPGLREDVGAYLEKWWLFGAAIGVSFFVTCLAIFMGHSSQPQSLTPQSLQMLFSNVVFDGLTLLVTVMILNRALSSHGSLAIPIAIMLDIVVSGVLACASLWGGLAFTDNDLTVFQVWDVLFGYSPEGRRVELGAYFWVMHTTFLPTFAYLVVIFVCWLARIAVLPVALVLKDASTKENPHQLTAALFTLVAVICGSLSTWFGYLEDAVKC